MAMVLTQSFFISDISAYLEVLDLCSLDATAKDISMASRDGHAYAWRTAATHANLSLGGVDKTSVKAVFGAVQKSDHDLHRSTIMLKSTNDVQAFLKATEQTKKAKDKHVQAGGKIGETFLTHISFTPEDVKSYLADPHAAVTSRPIPITIGKDTIELTMTWHRDAMWLSVHATPSAEKSFKPFGIQLRTVSSPLTLRKDFQVRNSKEKQQGTGLCCMLQSPSAFAQNMESGILCTGLLHDLETTRGSRSANALGLDNPGWRAHVEAHVEHLQSLMDTFNA
jgi:hypothetical protein